ncbi:unnamed protein product, partial [Adineta steineri]
VDNEIELAAPEGYGTLHTTASAQTLATNAIPMDSSDVVITRTVDGAYDNPVITIKD